MKTSSSIRRRPAHHVLGRLRLLGFLGLGTLVVDGCHKETWPPGPYRFCTVDGQCAANESCIEVRSTSADGGTALAGVCSSACTVSTLGESVYAYAANYGRVCVGIDTAGVVDTSTLGGAGWFLIGCGVDHLRIDSTEYRIACTPFDYAGYPIDLWIPTP